MTHQDFHQEFCPLNSTCQLCSFIEKELGRLQSCSLSNVQSDLESKRVKPFTGNPRDAAVVNRKPNELNLTTVILEELRRFCENTSIRGLPRIVRAQNRPMRLLWSTLVCILVLGCGTCLFFLSRQYLEYNVIHPPRVLRHTSSPFPSVTVCNLRPISPDGMDYLKQKGWKTPRQFATDLAYYTQYLYYNSHRMDEYAAASAAFSLAGFLESLPNDDERRKLGYLYNKLIIKCQMTYLNGSKPVAAPCDRKGRWRKFIHAQYLNCATFEPSTELRASTTNIEMYIYLNEMSDYALCPDCFHGEVKSQLSGALIVIDSADHLPNVNDKSINLKPGSLTEIRLSIVENIQKLPPYGRCSLDLPENLQLYGTQYAYSEYACREATIQNDIMEKCGCYSMEYPYNEDSGFEPCSSLPRFVNTSDCGSYHLMEFLRGNMTLRAQDGLCINDLKLFTKRMLCKRSVTENYVHGALPSCTMPCAFYSYEAEQSTSSWPTKRWQLTWLNSSYNRRLGIFDGPKFDTYREAQSLLTLGNETDAARILEQANILEQNLLAVLINRPNFDVRKVEEKEVLSLTSLLSQSGGLFSIWMGLSMIALGEVAELLISCYVKTKEVKTLREDVKKEVALTQSSTQFANDDIDNGLTDLLSNEKVKSTYKCRENHMLWMKLLACIRQVQMQQLNSEIHCSVGQTGTPSTESMRPSLVPNCRNHEHTRINDPDEVRFTTDCDNQLWELRECCVIRDCAM
ncbi:unnamed protein product [Dicrocoelium dendriticum]|nr:unnamed protein product [Dicrocoelium dendriticum]